MRGRVVAAVRTTARSLGIRNFRLFFVGQLVSQVGNWLTQVAQTLLVLHITNSGVAVGWLVACQYGPLLLFGAWTGLIADRKDKRRLLIVVQSAAMLQPFVLAALAFMHHPPLAAIYAVSLYGGVTIAFDLPTRRAFVTEMVASEDIANAVTLNTVLMTSARIFGPALAGALVLTVGFGWCFIVDGVSFVAVLGGLLMMRTAELRRPPVTPRSKGQVRAGLRYAASVPELRIGLVVTGVIGSLSMNFTVTLPLMIERGLHGGDGAYTAVYAVLSIGSMVAALAAAHRRSMDLRHMIVQAGAFGVSLALFALVPNLRLAFAVAVVIGYTSISFSVASIALVQIRADPVMRGRVVAMQSILAVGVTPIGGPILGAICDAFGPRAGIGLGAVAAVGATAWASSASRRAAVAMQLSPESTLPEGGLAP